MLSCLSDSEYHSSAYLPGIHFRTNKEGFRNHTCSSIVLIFSIFISRIHSIILWGMVNRIFFYWYSMMICTLEFKVLALQTLDSRFDQQNPHKKMSMQWYTVLILALCGKSRQECPKCSESRQPNVISVPPWELPYPRTQFVWCYPLVSAWTGSHVAYQHTHIPGILTHTDLHTCI